MKPEKLLIKKGIHWLEVFTHKEPIEKKNYAMISCTEDLSDTIDDDGDFMDEYESARIWINVDEIDNVIAKLNEIKEWINEQV